MRRGVTVLLMQGPLDHILSDHGFPELVVLTTDAGSGAVTVSLGEDWNHLLRDLVIDAGRQAQSEPSA